MLHYVNYVGFVFVWYSFSLDFSLYMSLVGPKLV